MIIAMCFECQDRPHCERFVRFFADLGRRRGFRGRVQAGQRSDGVWAVAWYAITIMIPPPPLLAPGPDDLEHPDDPADWWKAN